VYGEAVYRAKSVGSLVVVAFTLLLVAAAVRDNSAMDKKNK